MTEVLRTRLSRARRLLRQSWIYRALGPFAVHFRNHLFDLRYGVQTAGSVKLNRLHKLGSNAAHGIMYDTLDATVLMRIFRTVPIRYEDFVFIDFGAGKGKVALVASRFPFKRIIGVEFSGELIDIARKNVRRFHDPASRAPIELIHIDAVDFALPDDPAVLYFYNPFREPVMRRVLANIERSLELRPRNVLIIYLNPELDALIQTMHCFRKIISGPWHAIYEANCPPAGH